MAKQKLEYNEKQFRRIILSESDVFTARDICRHIIEKALWDEKNNPEAKTLGRWLQCAMVVSYIRPFSGNSENEHTLTRPDIGLDKELLPYYWQLHKKLLSLRNQVSAHTDADVRDLEINIHEAGVPTALSTQRNLERMISEKEYQDFLALFEKVGILLTEKHIQLQSALYPG